MLMERRKLGVLLPPDMYESVQKEANRMGITISTLIYMMIDQYLTGRSVMVKLPEIAKALEKLQKKETRKTKNSVQGK